MRFIETRVFTTTVGRLLTEESYRLLQLALALRPDAGKLIAGSGGLRKMRWGTPTHGKSGGVRVIYFWSRADATCYLLSIYPKNRVSTLTPRQLRDLRKLVAQELK